MGKIITTVTKTTTSNHSIKLGREEIIRALDNFGITVPSDAIIEFCVPGGGDWSNTNIGIDKGNPITVTWTETELRTTRRTKPGTGATFVPGSAFTSTARRRHPAFAAQNQRLR